MPTATEAPISPTYCETVRQQIGISRDEFLNAIGQPKRYSLLVAHRALAEPEVIRMVQRLEKAHADFLADRRAAMDFAYVTESFWASPGKDEAQNALPEVQLISTDDAVKATGLGEFAFSNLRNRDKLPYTTIDRQAYYQREHLDALFTWHLRTDVIIHRAIYAKPFLSYWKDRLGGS